MLIPVKVKRLIYQVGMILQSADFSASGCIQLYMTLMLQGFQVPYHIHILILVVFNQYLETILRLLPCYSLQRQESYLSNAQIQGSMFVSCSILSLYNIIPC